MTTLLCSNPISTSVRARRSSLNEDEPWIMTTYLCSNPSSTSVRAKRSSLIEEDHEQWRHAFASLCSNPSSPSVRARRSSLNEDELDSGSLLPGKPLVKKKSLSLDLRDLNHTSHAGFFVFNNSAKSQFKFWTVWRTYLEWLWCFFYRDYEDNIPVDYESELRVK